MDARLNVYGALGLTDGDAHVIRNAGGVVTDDEIRSLAISQRLLGTAKIILIHHTDCGMLTFTDDEFKNSIEQELGIKPEWAAESFPDLETDVRQSIARINAPNYPIIGDADFNLAKLYGMLPRSHLGRGEGADPADNQTGPQRVRDRAR
jgi:carbonic anhydrase